MTHGTERTLNGWGSYIIPSNRYHISPDNIENTEKYCPMDCFPDGFAKTQESTLINYVLFFGFTVTWFQQIWLYGLPVNG